MGRGGAEGRKTKGPNQRGNHPKGKGSLCYRPLVCLGRSKAWKAEPSNMGTGSQAPTPPRPYYIRLQRLQNVLLLLVPTPLCFPFRQTATSEERKERAERKNANRRVTSKAERALQIAGPLGACS